MSNFAKVSLGVNNKRYSHNLSFDNNTSCDFGSVQPLFCQLLSKDDSLSASIKQLVRLAPMPVPTFGRMRLINKLRFVSMSDICPAFEATLAQQYISNGDTSYLPTKLPWIQSSLLTFICLCKFSTCNLYEGTSSSMKRVTSVDNTKLLTVLKWLAGISQFTSNYDYTSSNLNLHFSLEEISFDGADYVVYDGTTRALTFRLSEDGKRFRKVLLGLGYVFDLTCGDAVSALPLFAYYKAYFDCYAPKREMQWNNTNAYTLIDYIYTNYSIDVAALGSSGNGISTDRTKTAFDKFIEDLAHTFYTIPDDFVSAHRVCVSNQNTSNFISLPTGSLSDFSDNNSVVTSIPNEAPYLTVNGTGDLNSFGLRALMRISKFINKDSVIGKRVSEWLKVHYGADVSSSFFKDSVSLDDIVVNCSVNDVFSTSDTVNGDNGEYLGSYAGKGLGFGDSSFSFDAPTFGYFIVLTCVAPVSGYYQGLDPSLFALDRFTFPSSEFDALGYEVTPKSVIGTHNDITLSNQDNLDAGFGFVPRFSGFKFRKDIVNGDMSRRGVLASNSPYYLDRILVSNHLRSSKQSDGSYQLVDSSTSLPLASDVWRYPTRYSWLGNFNRIFYNSGQDSFDSSSDNDLNIHPLDDNFNVQSVISMSLRSKLKPISLSYDTFDEDLDNNDKTVMQQ